VALVLVVETGSHFLVGGQVPSNVFAQLQTNANTAPLVQQTGIRASDLGALPHRPPGLALPDLAFIDGLLLLTLALMALSLVVRQSIVGRAQGIVNLVASIVVIILGIVALLTAVAKLVLMLALFLSPPFGTIAYFAAFGFFDRGGALAAVGSLLALKLGACIALVIAQERFLQNKGLVILVLLTLLLYLLVSILISIVPSFLASITDALGAIIVSIVAIIWAVLTLAFAIYATIEAV